MNLRITELNYQQLRRAIRDSFLQDESLALEIGCILLISKNNHPTNPSLIVKDVLIPDESDTDERSIGHVKFTAQFLRRSMLKVRGRRILQALSRCTRTRSAMILSRSLTTTTKMIPS